MRFSRVERSRTSPRGSERLTEGLAANRRLQTEGSKLSQRRRGVEGEGPEERDVFRGHRGLLSGGRPLARERGGREEVEESNLREQRHVATKRSQKEKSENAPRDNIVKGTNLQTVVLRITQTDHKEGDISEGGRNDKQGWQQKSARTVWPAGPGQPPNKRGSVLGGKTGFVNHQGEWNGTLGDHP